MKVKYIVKRKGSDSLQYLRNVKPQHRHLFGGKRQIWKSLKTNDQRSAIKSAAVISAWFENVIRAWEQSLDSGASNAEKAPQPSRYYEDLLPSALDDRDWAEHLAGLDTDSITSLLAEERKKYGTAAELREGLQKKLDEFSDRLFFSIEAMNTDIPPLERQMHKAQIIGMRGLIEQYNLMRRVNAGESPAPLNSELYVPLRKTVSSPTLGELSEMYLANYTKSQNPKTLAQKRSRLAALVNTIGPATNISNVTVEQVLDLRDNLLPRLPARDNQVIAAMPHRDKADYAGKNRLPVLSVKTQGLYFSEWKTFFRSVPVVTLLGRNLLDGLSFKGGKFHVAQREGFTVEELNKIFTAPLYTGCAGEESGDWDRPGKQVVKKSKFWVPLISLFSGMTVAEICDLQKVDVHDKDGIVSLDVKIDPERNRTVKTKSRIRRVPVHPELIKIGFRKYVADLPDGPLFPDLDAEKPSDAFGKWFLRFRLSIGVDRAVRPKVSFHSFRHSFREGCRESEIPDYAAKRIGGWSPGPDQQSRYGKPDVAKLHAQLAKLEFPGLKLSHLYT